MFPVVFSCGVVTSGFLKRADFSVRRYRVMLSATGVGHLHRETDKPVQHSRHERHNLLQLCPQVDEAAAGDQQWDRPRLRHQWEGPPLPHHVCQRGQGFCQVHEHEDAGQAR